VLDPQCRGSAVALKTIAVGKFGSRCLYIPVWEYVSRERFWVTILLRSLSQEALNHLCIQI
jgi:hypothetical protein